jgi:hypothetical protein
MNKDLPDITSGGDTRRLGNSNSEDDEHLTTRQENTELKLLVANLVLRNRMLKGRVERYKSELRELKLKGE